MEKKQPEPYALITGDVNNPDQGFLIVDCKVIGEIDLLYVPLNILAAYFVYNICYIKGCHNMFSYLEVLFLNACPDKMPSSIKRFITALHNS